MEGDFGGGGDCTTFGLPLFTWNWALLLAHPFSTRSISFTMEIMGCRHAGHSLSIESIIQFQFAFARVKFPVVHFDSTAAATPAFVCSGGGLHDKVKRGHRARAPSSQPPPAPVLVRLLRPRPLRPTFRNNDKEPPSEYTRAHARADRGTADGMNEEDAKTCRKYQK